MQMRQSDGKIQALYQDSKDYVLMIMLEPLTVQLVNLDTPNKSEPVKVIRIAANDIMSHPVIMDMHFVDDEKGLELVLKQFNACGVLKKPSTSSSLTDLAALGRNGNITAGSGRNVFGIRQNIESESFSGLSDDERSVDCGFELPECVIQLGRRPSPELNKVGKTGSVWSSAGGSFQKSKLNSWASSGNVTNQQSRVSSGTATNVSSRASLEAPESRSGSLVPAAFHDTVNDGAGPGEFGAAMPQNHRRASLLRSGQRNHLQEMPVNFGKSKREIDPEELAERREFVHGPNRKLNTT